MVLRVIRLEDRLLFDASAAAVVAQAANADGDGHAADQAAAENTALAAEPQSDSSDGVAGDPNAQSAAEPVNVLVVSSRVEYADQLAAAAAEDVVVVLYDAENSSLQDLFGEVEQALDGRLADTIGFATHGQSGLFHLTQNIYVTATEISDNAALQSFWQDLGSLMHEGGRLDLLGCNIGGVDGNDFGLLDALDQALDSSGNNVDIAASTDMTGNGDGQNWLLEVGMVDATQYFDNAELNNWAGSLATINVTNTDDSGAGSLRQAIIDANAAAGPHTIEFVLDVASPQVITLASSLDVITEQVTLNGIGATNYAFGTNMVTIDGNGAAGNILDFGAGSANSEVLGLNLVGGTGNGIQINADGIVVKGNVIGLTLASVDDGNGGEGIYIVSGTGGVIGGAGAGERNIVSGNAGSGITIASGTHTIQNNFIGTSIDGTADRGNDIHGLTFLGGSNHIVGGNSSAGEGNVISGNQIFGVGTDNTSGVVFKGNFVGTDLSGTLVLSNGGTGIGLEAGSSDWIVGSTVAGEGNVLANNSFAGIFVDGSAANGNTIRGNSMYANNNNIFLANGGNNAGDAPTITLDNAFDVSSGLVIRGGIDGIATTWDIDFYANSVGENGAETYLGSTTATTSGLTPIELVYNGSTAGFDNVTAIATNQATGDTYTVSSTQALETAYAVTNTNDSGAGSLRQAIIDTNANAGLDYVFFFLDLSSSNQVTLASGLDVITDEIYLDGTTATNYAFNDTAPLMFSIDANGLSGRVLTIEGGNSTITGLNIVGATSSTQGNEGYGIDLQSDNNVVKQNIIGIDLATGNADGNAGAGVAVSAPANGANADGNIIGGTDPADRNYIAGNGNDTGRLLKGNVVVQSADNTQIIGNVIGLSWNGTALGTGDGIVAGIRTSYGVGNGIPAGGESTNLTIGDMTNPVEGRNVISGNLSGLYFNGVAGTINVVGNYIGTDVTGTLDRGNTDDGIELFGDGNETFNIGGTAANLGNVISANGDANFDGAIEINSNLVNTSIIGNYIGVDATGGAALGNYSWGIRTVGSGHDGITISNNVISNNGLLQAVDGVAIFQQAANSTVTDNIVGLDATGTIAMGNGKSGLRIDSSGGNTITGNTVGANAASGIEIKFNNSIVQDNIIGTDASGTMNLGNQDYGVYIYFGASGSDVGGTGVGEGNVIAYNVDGGINVDGAATIGNTILGNSIYQNAGGGILLTNGGNNSGDAPTIDITNAYDGSGTYAYVKGSFDDANFPQSWTVEFYQNLTGEDQARELIGRETINSSSASDSFAYQLMTVTSGYDNVVAIATNDTTGDTYQISASEAYQDGLVVANTNDSGALSLRQAIIDANDNSDTNSIIFELDASSSTINLSTPLDSIIYPVLIDGTTAANYSFQGNMVAVRSNGDFASNSSGFEFSTGSDGSLLKGLDVAISGSSSRVVYVESDSVTIEENILANPGSGITRYGVYISGGADAVIDNNIIGFSKDGTVDRGFTDYNLRLFGADSIQIKDNRIGSGIDGSVFMGAATDVVITGNIFGLDSNGNTIGDATVLSLFGVGDYSNLQIGGPNAADRNIFAVNAPSNVIDFLELNSSSDYTGLLVQNNWFGLDETGLAAATNQERGRFSLSSGADVTNAQILNNVFANTGVTLDGTGTNMTFQGNYVGMDKDGVSLSNSGNGVLVSSDNWLVGGTIVFDGGGAVDISKANIIGNNTSSASGNYGINIVTDGSSIQGNIIGLDINGSAAANNAGININGSSGNAVIGGSISEVGGTVTTTGNIISGNTVGVDWASGAPVNVVFKGNIVGLDLTGAAAGNGIGFDLGLLANFTIGGTNASDRNIISGNSTGIASNIFNNSADIYGNYFGTDVSGQTAISNTNYDIDVGGTTGVFNIGGTAAGEGNLFGGSGTVRLTGSSHNIYGNTFGLAADGTTDIGSGTAIQVTGGSHNIGGISDLSDGLGVGDYGNVISGNDTAILISGTGSANIFGNIIGMDAAGTSVISSGTQQGITVSSSATSQIGSSADDTGNIISGNTSAVVLSGGSQLVQGNLIGTERTGLLDRGNTLDGVSVTGGSGHLIGGTGAGEANTIAFSGDNGVEVVSVSGVSILSNSIFENTGSAIVNNASGAPTLSIDLAVDVGDIELTVDGDLVDSSSPQDWRLQFYANPTGEDQARYFLGSATLTSTGTDGYQFVYNGSTVGFENVTATATNVTTGDTYALVGPESILQAVLVTNTNDSGAGSLRQAIIDVNAEPAGGVVIFSLDVATSQTINLLSDLDDLTGVITIDGTSATNYAFGTNMVTVSGATSNTFNLLGGDSSIRGLNIINSGSYAIRLDSGNNTVESNVIGIDLSSTVASNQNGVGVISGSDNAISNNIISGNTQSGVVLATDSTATTVTDNFIGTDISGTLDRGNSENGVVVTGTEDVVMTSNIISFNDDNGVLINGSSTNNMIGGTGAGEGNTIANNGANETVGLAGVVIDGAGSTGNSILGNSIYQNFGSGINLLNGANNSADSPTITINDAYNGAGLYAYLKGDFDDANFPQSWTVELYQNLTGEDQARNFLGRETIDSESASDSFVFQLMAATAGYENVVAIATNDATGDTYQISGSEIYKDGLVVANSNNSGALSLRQAILDANSVAGVDNVVFDVDVGSVAVGIEPTTLLPTITEGINLDATTAANYNFGTNMVEITGNFGRFVIAGQGTTIKGLSFHESNSPLFVDADNVTIQQNLFGLDFNGNVSNNFGANIDIFSGNNILIGGTGVGEGNVISGSNSEGIIGNGGTNVMVYGNIIGLDRTGTLDRGNASYGIHLQSGADTWKIGGGGSEYRNVISGNDSIGIWIKGSSHTVQGNYIGLAADGVESLGNNTSGIFVESGDNHLIGGTGAGEGNVISGNGLYGINANGGTDVNIYQNIIGLDVTGTLDRGNTFSGIYLLGTADRWQIGGASDLSDGLGAGDYGNIISGNNSQGISISNGTHTIQGNYIGLGADGEADLGNTSYGLYITAGSDTLIGGSDDGSGDYVLRNYISGNNSYGIYISGGSGHDIKGNVVGLSLSGEDVGNSSDGIVITAPSTGVTVGGASDAERNIVSGNNGDGIYVTSSGHTIQNNYIGTDVSGTIARGNSVLGISIFSSSSNISILDNVVSANGNDNVQISGNNQTVQGNIIGLSADGTIALGQGEDGLQVFSASGVVVRDNVISGGAYGVYVLGTTTNLEFRGNKVGVGLDGTGNFGHTYYGIEVLSGASDIFIGGTTAADRNIIANNGSDGIRIRSSTQGVISGYSVVVQGNYIGVDGSGAVAAGNGNDGISFFNGSGNALIGGVEDGAGNVVANSGRIQLIGFTATNVEVYGNIFGLDATGTVAMGNGSYSAVQINNSTATGWTVGGSTAAHRNIIAAGAAGGLFVGGTDHVIQGNYIGTDISGTLDRGNTGSGIDVWSTASNILVGGSNPGEGNVVSANTENGISIIGNSITVQGNYVGTDASGMQALGNGTGGIVVTDGDNIQIGGSSDFSGGSLTGAGNLVANNRDTGIYIGHANAFSTGQIQGNVVGLNVQGEGDFGNGFGIFLQGTANGVLVGGATADLGNYVANSKGSVALPDFDAHGITVFTNNNTIQNNVVGLTFDGQAAGNGASGIALLGGEDQFGNIGRGNDNMVLDNVLSSNDESGLYSDSGTGGNTIQGNLIGTDQSGLVDRGNTLYGIHITSGDNNLIGGTEAGNGNVIAYNGADGVRLDAVYGNTVFNNSIYGNEGRGIYMLNDANNSDTLSVNFTSAIEDDGLITLKGLVVDPSAGNEYTIQFFAYDSSGSAAVQFVNLLGEVTVTTASPAPFTFTYNGELPAGADVVAATATNFASGDTLATLTSKAIFFTPDPVPDSNFAPPVFTPSLPAQMPINSRIGFGNFIRVPLTPMDLPGFISDDGENQLTSFGERLGYGDLARMGNHAAQFRMINGEPVLSNRGIDLGYGNSVNPVNHVLRPFDLPNPAPETRQLIQELSGSDILDDQLDGDFLTGEVKNLVDNLMNWFNHE